MAETVTPVNEQASQYLIQTKEAVHLDDTGERVDCMLRWMHIASTEMITHLEMHDKHGTLDYKDISILPDRTGWVVYDGYHSNNQYSEARHVLCNTQHLRELLIIHERYLQPWTRQMLKMLLEIKQAVENAQRSWFSSLSPVHIADFENRYSELLDQRLKTNLPLPVQDPPVPKKRGRIEQSPPKNLEDHLHKHQHFVLAFMYDFKVPFDNNLAKRELRLVKLKQKVSGCFRSMQGARTFCRIWSYISTNRKKDLFVLDTLGLALIGNPFYPLFRFDKAAITA